MALSVYDNVGDGQTVAEVTLGLASGATARVLDRGAILRDLQVPLGGGLRRVVLGYRNLDAYLTDRAYIGATVGRYGNRIAHGRFAIDGKTHRVPCNEKGRHHLHGGNVGFSRRRWRIVDHDAASVTLALASPDGEEGYPGSVEARCTYRLVEPATLAVSMTATADAPTVVNLVNHSYFTFTPGQPIRGHRLQVAASRYTPVDGDLIPTGEIRAVDGTPYDFRALRPIATAEAGATEYDVNFVLDRDRDGLFHAATVTDPAGRLRMELHTSEPGLQFYEGIHLGPGEPGLDGRPFFKNAALCLEPGRFPDSPNHANFSSAVLRPGETYRQLIEYRFADN